VAHSYNPNYSGGRNQENHSLKPAWANSLQDLISKKPFTKNDCEVAQNVGPEFKPQSSKKKKQEPKDSVTILKHRQSTQFRCIDESHEKSTISAQLNMAETIAVFKSS
jgi:hypothetical protein